MTASKSRTIGAHRDTDTRDVVPGGHFLAPFREAERETRGELEACARATGLVPERGPQAPRWSRPWESPEKITSSRNRCVSRTGHMNRERKTSSASNFSSAQPARNLRRAERCSGNSRSISRPARPNLLDEARDPEDCEDGRENQEQQVVRGEHGHEGQQHDAGRDQARARDVLAEGARPQRAESAQQAHASVYFAPAHGNACLPTRPMAFTSLR